MVMIIPASVMIPKISEQGLSDGRLESLAQFAEQTITHIKYGEEEWVQRHLDHIAKALRSFKKEKQDAQ